MTNNLFQTAIGPVHIQKYLGRGKSGDAYLATQNGQTFVLKRMHYDPCPYYQFNGNKVELEVAAYRTLQKTGIPLPQLIAYDAAGQYLLKTYLDGPVATDWIIAGNSDPAIISQLFLIATQVKAHNLNIDYFPGNFVITGDTLYYIDYEINPYLPEWDLIHWGIYYWANPQGMAHYRQTGDATAINLNPNSGKPITAPFEATVQAWINQFYLE